MTVLSEKIELLPGVSIQPRIVQTAKGPVECDLSAGDGPVALVCHGGIGGVDQARVIAAWLDPRRYRILSVSRPGYLGTPLDSGRGFEDQADLFAALLDALDLDKAAVIAASAGGPPAYAMAIRHPERVWALVAIDCVSGYYDMPETAGAIAQAIFTTDLGQKLLKKIGEARPDLFLKQIFQSEAYFTKSQLKAHLDYAMGSDEAKDFVRAFMNTMNPYATRKPGTDNDMVLMRQLTHLPVERIACPTLIVHGTHDADVKFYDGVYAHEHIVGSERFWIEEGSHLGFWLSPNAPLAQRAARDFLDRHRP
ncbi:alpha/beta fold hydrolase [Desulfarculus baarsii]|uniref:alpha/beta fold hydrolase n=1 Tax=Desulfarculus baarsii TaxID=453230 RepID=UPI0038996AF9